jgi:hypothetical protein
MQGQVQLIQFTYLTDVFNRPFSKMSVFPDGLKYALIKPCFKKGNIQEIANYRPI